MKVQFLASGGFSMFSRLKKLTAKLCGIFSLLLFTISAAWHLLSYQPRLCVSMDHAERLFLPMLIPFIFLIISLSSRQKLLQPVFPMRSWKDFWATPWKNGKFFSKLSSLAPRPVRIIGYLLLYYCFINFFYLGLSGKVEGEPTVKNGGYFLKEKDKILHELNKAEYLQANAYLVRLITGHFMMFCWLPAVYFLLVYPQLDKLKAPEMKEPT